MNADDITIILTFTNARNITNVLMANKYINEIATNYFWKTIYYSNSCLPEKYKNKICNYYEEFINFTKLLPVIISHSTPIIICLPMNCNKILLIDNANLIYKYNFNQKVLGNYFIRSKIFICYNERGVYRDTYIYEKLQGMFLENAFSFLSDNIKRMPHNEFYFTQINNYYIVFHRNNFWAIMSENDIFYVEYDDNIYHMSIIEIGDMYVITKQYVEKRYLIGKSSIIVVINKCSYAVTSYFGNKKINNKLIKIRTEHQPNRNEMIKRTNKLLSNLSISATLEPKI